MLAPEWEPRRHVSRPAMEDPQDQGSDDDEPNDDEPNTGWKSAFRLKDNDNPLHHIRVFVSDSRNEKPTFGTQAISVTEPEDWDLEEAVAYTDGSCSLNGTANAVAGAGVWFGEHDERNMAARVPNVYASNNGGELLAVLLALQTNRNTKWIDEGFLRTKNGDLLRQIYFEIASVNNTVLLLAELGARGEDADPDDVDLQGCRSLERTGALLVAMSQSLLKTLTSLNTHSKK